MEYEKELNAALEAALKAKEVVLKYYYSGFNVEIKEDSSPVTDADKASDKIIRDYLGARFDYAFLTEESADSKERLNSDYVWIVDPIDGTMNFVKQHNNGHFLLNLRGHVVACINGFYYDSWDCGYCKVLTYYELV